MKPASATLLIVAVIAAVGFDASARGPTKQPGDRLLVAISDLHFGVGRQGDRWHPMEDFRWGDEFRQFLDEIHRQGGGRTDLVIAGDTFELWQSLQPRDCVAANLDAGCSEAEALGRLKNVTSAHAAVLKAIGAFANAGDNRVVFVPGNHDAALLFPAVGQAAEHATGARTGRVRVETAGFWLSAGGRVLVEHGHQMGQEVNRMRGWPTPFVGSNPVRLERSWGEQFVQEFYNQYEAKYPIIDNVSEEGVGVRYAREIEGWLGTARAAGRFVHFYVTKLSLWQHAAALGNESSVPWDLESVRRAGSAFLAESVPADDPVGRAIRRPGVDLGVGPDGFTDEELLAICEARAQIHAYQRANGVADPTISPCPVKDPSLGAVGQTLLRRTRDSILREYLSGRFAQLRKSAGITEPFKIYIYGHTHGADSGFRPLATSHPDWNPIVLNTGAWQRTVTPEQLRGLECRAQSGRSVIELQPDDLPPCYSAVFVRPTAPDRPELRYWTRDAAGAWRFESTCQWTAPCSRNP